MPRTLSRTRTGDTNDTEKYAPEETPADSSSDSGDGGEGGTARKAGRVDRAARKPQIRRGWGAVEAYEASRPVKTENKFADSSLSLQDAKVLIKFLEFEPFQAYEEHWIQEAPTTRKSYVCPTSLDLEDYCPLCEELGDEPAFIVAFNVAVYDDVQGSWDVKVLKGRERIRKAVKALTDGRTTKPINKDDLYFDAFKEGTKKDTVPIFQPVRARDLEDDPEGVQPLTTEQLGDLVAKCWDKYAFAPKREDLTALVAAIP